MTARTPHFKKRLQSRIDEAGVPQVSETRILPDISTCQLAFRMRYQVITTTQVEIQAVQVWVIPCRSQSTALQIKKQHPFDKSNPLPLPTLLAHGCSTIRHML